MITISAPRYLTLLSSSISPEDQSASTNDAHKFDELVEPLNVVCLESGEFRCITLRVLIDPVQTKSFLKPTTQSNLIMRISLIVLAFE